MITPQNLLRHELCGLTVRVINASHKGYVKEGEVVSETRDTIELKTKKGVKTVPKKECVFQFQIPGDVKVTVNGNLLTGRPQDRVKKKTRIRYDKK